MCQEKKDGWVSVTVSAGYMADSPAEVTITLETEAGRLAQDIGQLVTLAASMRTCAFLWSENGKKNMLGTGSLCPKDGEHF